MTLNQAIVLRLVAEKALALSSAMVQAEADYNIDFDDFVEEEWQELSSALEELRAADSESKNKNKEINKGNIWNDSNCLWRSPKKGKSK